MFALSDTRVWAVAGALVLASGTGWSAERDADRVAFCKKMLGAGAIATVDRRDNGLMCSKRTDNGLRLEHHKVEATAICQAQFGTGKFRRVGERLICITEPSNAGNGTGGKGATGGKGSTAGGGKEAKGTTGGKGSTAEGGKQAKGGSAGATQSTERKADRTAYCEEMHGAGALATVDRRDNGLMCSKRTDNGLRLEHHKVQAAAICQAQFGTGKFRRVGEQLICITETSREGAGTGGQGATGGNGGTGGAVPAPAHTVDLAEYCKQAHGEGTRLTRRRTDNAPMCTVTTDGGLGLRHHVIDLATLCPSGSGPPRLDGDRAICDGQGGTPGGGSAGGTGGSGGAAGSGGGSASAGGTGLGPPGPGAGGRVVEGEFIPAATRILPNADVRTCGWGIASMPHTLGVATRAIRFGKTPKPCTGFEGGVRIEPGSICAFWHDDTRRWVTEKEDQSFRQSVVPEQTANGLACQHTRLWKNSGDRRTEPVQVFLDEKCRSLWWRQRNPRSCASYGARRSPDCPAERPGPSGIPFGATVLPKFVWRYADRQLTCFYLTPSQVAQVTGAPPPSSASTPPPPSGSTAQPPPSETASRPPPAGSNQAGRPSIEFISAGGGGRVLPTVRAGMRFRVRVTYQAGQDPGGRATRVTLTQPPGTRRIEVTAWREGSRPVFITDILRLGPGVAN